MQKVCLTFSFRETETRAFGFGQKLMKRGPRKARATVVALSGELGAGKTAFVSGLAKGLGVKRRIQSPTFVFIRRSRLNKGGFENLFHIDAYRMKKDEKIDFLRLQEIFSNSRNVVAVEWPENLDKIFFRGAAKILMQHGRAEGERRIKMCY